MVKIITLKNGSKVEIYTSTAKSIRSNRSKLISFWCDNCKKVHEKVPISEMMCISDNLTICKTSYEKVIEPYLNGMKGENTYD